MSAKVAARLLCRLAVLPGEYGNALAGRSGVLHSKTNRRAHLAGCASAYGVDHQHGGTRLSQRGVYLGGGACLFQAGARQFLAHRNQHNLWVHKIPPGKPPVQNCFNPDCTGVGEGTPDFLASVARRPEPKRVAGSSRGRVDTDASDCKHGSPRIEQDILPPPTKLPSRGKLCRSSHNCRLCCVGAENQVSQ